MEVGYIYIYLYIYIYHLTEKKAFRESLLVDKHSVFRFFVLQVENKALESGTKQCSFHVHGGQVKSKALLEVEIIFCHLKVHLWLVYVGIILVHLPYMLIDLDILAIM